jgi:hypothetical protein
VARIRACRAYPPTLSFNADGEIEELASQARAEPPVGASTVSGPVATPWNSLDVRVTDPAGHRLVFTARNPEPDPETAARIQAMIQAGRRQKPAP